MEVLTNEDREIVLYWLRIQCTGVTEVPMHPETREQEVMLFERIKLVQDAFDRAARDHRMSADGKRILQRADAFKTWLAAEENYLKSKGVYE